MSLSRQKLWTGLELAWRPVVEALESRRMFSTSTIQTLPFLLDFGSDRGELADKDGQGTGFTRVQTNRVGNEYQPALIDLDTTAGLLKLTTTGTSTAGSNTNGDNTLVNALETQFDATTTGFKITARLVGPLGYINAASHQGGISFGPDQDNYVKLVAIAQSGQQYIQFSDEQTTGATYNHALGFNTLASVGSFSNINTLDLQLVGDAGAGTVNAYYAINGTAFVKINATLTLTGPKKAAFFNNAGRAGLITLQKNNLSPITVLYDSFSIESGIQVEARPAVTASRPANGEANVPRNAFVAADVSLPTPGAGIDTLTLTSANVKLYRTSDRAPIEGVLNTSGGGDAIVLTPAALLDPNTSYTFEVTSGLTDTSGAPFLPYTASFTAGNTGGETDPSLAFEKITLPTANGQIYTGVTVGPDGRLYASTIDGIIQRFDINADGTLASPFNITSLQTNEGGPRLLIGMAFDSSGDLWVSHNQYTDLAQPTANDWTGKISRLSGVNYQTVTTAVINLPRSVRDHLTNQLAFGPDGALYFAQGANTAMGAPDNAWGLRSEHLLNAAILRLDVTQVGANPIDVQTDSGGTYNPYAPDAPLTIYASGVRNAYDLVWTTDGRLYAPNNGSAAGGSTPGTPVGSYSYGPNQRIDYATNGAYTDPNVTALSNVQQTQNDYLFNIVQGGYYGNPNPTHGEFVLNGGNPTAGIDPNEVPSYPVGTLPDRNYRGNITGAQANTNGSAFVFGKNYSPDGIIEYKSNAFGGALKGKLLVAEYSGGDEIVVLTADANGNITRLQNGIAGLTHFTDPLDLTENPATGFIYVAEYGGQKLTLVRPITPGANVSTDKSQMVFNDPTSAGASTAQKITITNTGTTALAFPADGLQITGTDAARFSITQKPTLPRSIAPGESIDVFVNFTATTVDDIRAANLQIKTNDPDTPIVNILLRGLGTSGTGGANEPSLQQLMNLYRIPINVGDTSPNETNLNDPPAGPNDELEIPLLVKESTGPVTIEPLAVFGAGDAAIPTFRLGTYTPGNKNDLTELLNVVGVANSQSVNSTVNGVTSFDPGGSPFGLYTYWQKFTATGSPTVYSEDRLNQTYDSHSPRKLRFYPLKTADSAVVPNAYVFAWEEFNNGYDNQDFVGIIRNVKPAGLGAEIGFENLDGLPYSDRMVFNRVQNPNNISPLADNTVHDTAKLRIRNTGTSNLDISSLVASSGWQIEGAPAGAFTLTPGGAQDITVRFIANPGGNTSQTFNGTLTINSNDADEPVSIIQLAGNWQPVNENNKEPSLQQVANLFGYQTVITKPGQVLNQHGLVSRVGDEVMSPYWKRVDGTLPVSVRQLSAFHSQGNTATARWHTKGSTTTTNLFTHDSDEGQSFLPHKDNGAFESINAANIAFGTFAPAGTFGFRIDNEWSDDTNNPQEQTGGNYGHHVRFFVARDRAGNIVPNTYIMTMDYSGINYDYNDNTYLVTNLKPESGPSVPSGVMADASGAGIATDWNDNSEANLAGYNIYRSSSADGTYTKLNSTLLTGSDFLDVTAPLGSTSYYRVTAVDNAGTESAVSATVSALRTTDTTAPVAPKNLVATGSISGIQLDWSNNTEADLAGYTLYRSSSQDGPFTKLNIGLLSSSDFFDTSAPVGIISYYQVTAVDAASNESNPANASSTRPSNDQTPPAVPSGAIAGGDATGISIDWNDNSEVDLAGYNIYRSDSANGTFVKLNQSLLTTSFFLDSGAPVGITSFYRITAVDAANNESAFAAANAQRPTDIIPPEQPTGLTIGASLAGINLDWANNTEGDLAGYNVYRSDAIDGVFTLLNTSGPINVSNYLDSAAPQGVVSYYRLTAVDASNNESTPATGDATRPIPDTLPPSAPVGLSSSTTAGGNQLDWLDNLESDLAGYFVYRGTSANGPWTKLTATPRVSSDYLDATAPSGTSYYLVTAVDTSINESIPAATDATRVATYTQVDIGNPTLAGALNAIIEGTDYNLQGSGADIYGTADSFSFGYQQVTGNFDWKVRVAGLTNTNSFAKAGLMARESLIAGSRNAFVLATPASNGHRFTYRGGTNGITTSTGGGAVTYLNNWLRLTRIANTFAGYRSTDGVNWTLVGQTTLNMPGTVFFGMAATSHTNSALTTAQFRGLQTNIAPPDNQPPATPGNVSAIGSSSGIQLDWNNNTEADLAGYNVYRSDSENGTFVKLNTSALLIASDFLDTTASVGVASFYRVTAVDAFSNESNFTATSATRPAGVSSVKINFQLNGSPTVVGYEQDNGDVFGIRGNGLTYGWNKSHTNDDRDRNKLSDQLLDTLVQMQSNSNWSINIANGTYTVKISVGDAQYASNNTVNVNGVNYWTSLALGANGFAVKTMTIIVTNGRIVLDNVLSPDRMTKLNYIEITPA